MDNTKALKSWLNYNLPQSNNWIIMYKFDEIVNHQSRQYYNIINNKPIPVDADKYQIISKDVSHIYFTYFTESLLISLIETFKGDLFLINNKMIIKENTNDTANTIEPLPDIVSIQSKIYHLEHITQIKQCLTKKEKKAIGLYNSQWTIDKINKIIRDELKHISYMDFININTETEYIELFNQYIKQSKDTLNLSHNYSINMNILNQIETNTQITTLTINQNFQINNLLWLCKFPNIKIINLSLAHQIEQTYFEQLINTLPNIETININCCTRINLRILIPILKLKHLDSLTINDPNFWCQYSIHELFISHDEWKGIYCPSLHKITINSHNLTLDVIDYLITSCPNIQQFTTDEKVNKILHDKIEGGSEQDNIICFNSWQNPKHSFYINKKIYIKGLLKYTYNKQMFSDSMLRKINNANDAHNNNK